MNNDLYVLLVGSSLFLGINAVCWGGLAIALKYADYLSNSRRKGE
jgi:hypothetical protein